ncbi:MAG: hypothetical protein KJ955_03450 [Nanoarchaeota archaeon]|nr:hypothetical protein [Nanoarchaeota archaeon]
MEPITFPAASDLGYRGNLTHWRLSFPDRGYLREYLGPSEPDILFLSQEIDNPMELFDSEAGKNARILAGFGKRAKALEKASARKKANEEKAIRKELKALPVDAMDNPWSDRMRLKANPFGRLKDGDAFEIACNETDADLSTLVSMHYVRLPWDKVRLQVNDYFGDRGYFICFGWNPNSRFGNGNTLYFAGPDFVPNRTEEEIRERLRNVPKGRGLPDDVLQTRANCGPTAMAAYLNLPVASVLEKAPLWFEKGYLSVTPMQEALEKLGKPHERIKPESRPSSMYRALGKAHAGLIRVQFMGSGNPDKYMGWRCWSQQDSFTHWIAYDRGQVYDFNARHEDLTLGDWIPESRWAENIVPLLMPESCSRYFARDVLVPA